MLGRGASSAASSSPLFENVMDELRMYDPRVVTRRWFAYDAALNPLRPAYRHEQFVFKKEFAVDVDYKDAQTATGQCRKSANAR